MQRGQGRSRGSPSVLVRPHTGQCQPAARTSAASTVETEPSGKRTSTPMRRSSIGSPPQAVRRLTRTELSKASTRPSVSMPVMLDGDAVADRDAEREPRLLEALAPGDADGAGIPADAEAGGVLEDRVFPPGRRGGAVLALAELGVGPLGEQLERVAHEIARRVDRAHRLSALLALGIGGPVGVVFSRGSAVGVAELAVVDGLVERQSEPAQGIGEWRAHVGGLGW